MPFEAVKARFAAWVASLKLTREQSSKPPPEKTISRYGFILDDKERAKLMDEGWEKIQGLTREQVLWLARQDGWEWDEVKKELVKVKKNS